MSEQWFIKPVGENQEALRKMIAKKMARKGMSSKMKELTIINREVIQVFEVTSEMVDYLKKERVTFRFSFSLFRIYVIDYCRWMSSQDFYSNGSESSSEKWLD